MSKALMCETKRDEVASRQPTARVQKPAVEVAPVALAVPDAPDAGVAVERNRVLANPEPFAKLLISMRYPDIGAVIRATLHQTELLDVFPTLRTKKVGFWPVGCAK